MNGSAIPRTRLWASIAAGLLAALFLGGCSVESASQPQGNGGGSDELGGEVVVDGSSTVFPISQAVAEEFMKKHPGVRVKVGTSGTGGGFKRFYRGETDINDASRPIGEDEKQKCDQNGIEYIELKVATDGLSVLVNPDNDWCDCLTVAQLKEIWKPGRRIQKWNQLNPDWPDEEIKLFGADTESGTFDYFTASICGSEGASRNDYTASTDDNVLVRGIAGEKYALGYFGYAYYAENKNKLQVVGVSPTGEKADCVEPTPQTIETGQYKPLSRPLYLYVNREALQRPEVMAFLQYYLSPEGQELVQEVGYVRLGRETVEKQRQKLE